MILSWGTCSFLGIYFNINSTSGTLIFAYPRNRTILIIADQLLVTISNYEQLLVTMNVMDRLSNPDYILPI